jgi:GNAT superfamily N-acetyltransferase
MVARLRAGTTYGYLAYVGGRPGGWVNASIRAEYSLFRRGDGAQPGDDVVVGVACFIVAPPYRRHGLSRALLERVIADAPQRGAAYVEAYPLREHRGTDAGRFRGAREMYDALGFEPVAERVHDVVVRRSV